MKEHVTREFITLPTSTKNTSLNDLILNWYRIEGWMRTYAEEAFFAGDEDREKHFAALTRQWERAIKELREVIYNSSLDVPAALEQLRN